ncbi:hypothetical protein F4813DRAFT_391406 [Daldinia decipiens]|uniref:uncharacterized protein n=1 Tax=Daldinia decipiens TaxID=326647 RepID=UPI0020C22FBB|nr:uncharacterized protein F4813DRAFT_391406 [Daldinia decipiens]KAI1655834.1 hypothetical protein F4813DRAFT_391406 [Daldinia decipiens]
MPSKETSVPSAGDQKFFAVLFKYLPAGLDLDWDGLAQELNLKNTKIAKTRFSQIRRKYQQGEAAGSSQQGNASKVTKPTKGKKAKVAGKGQDDNDGYDDDEDVKPATKKEVEDDAEGVVKIEDGDDELIAT